MKTLQIKKHLLLIYTFAILMCLLGCKSSEFVVTVDFDNGDQQTLTIEEGQVVGSINEPIKEGYTFAGWTLDGNEFSLDSAILSNITIKAKWNINSYNITYVCDGKETVKTYKYNEEIIPETPTKEGNTFLGWFYDNSLNTFTKMPAHDITLEAKFELNDVVVTFINESNKNDVNVPYGTKVEEPTSPVKEGYSFTGWYSNDTLFDFNTEIIAKTILEAKFEQAKLSIVLNNQDDKTEVNVLYGEKAEQPADPTKEGHTFVGWYNNDTLFDFNTEIKENIELTAKFEINKYNVNYIVGDVTIETKSFEYKTSVKIDGSKKDEEGRTFVGWSYEGKIVADVIVEKEIDLIAVYDNNEYTITLNTNGGSSIEPIKVLYSESISEIEVPVFNGYSFVGWFINDEVFALQTMPANDLVLEAKWELATYKIEYNLNGGKWPRDVSYSTRADLVNDFLKDASKFTNLTLTKENFSGTTELAQVKVSGIFESDDFVSETLKYKEKWGWFKSYMIEVRKASSKSDGVQFLSNSSDTYYNTFWRYEISAFLNENEVTSWPFSSDYSLPSVKNGYYSYLPGEDKNIIKEYNIFLEDIVLESPVRDNTQFSGWFNDSGEIVTIIPKGSFGDVSLIAYWDYKEYKINYVLNGGNGDNLDHKFNSLMTEDLYLKAPTKDGYAFMGFYETSDFTGTQVQKIRAGENKDKTLYAYWVECRLVGGLKKVSFYGDSISTFQGFVPKDAAYYYPTYSATVKSAEGTWWKKFMEGTGTQLVSNVSYSGSTVVGYSKSCGENIERVKELAGFDGTIPDIVIIYLGINDVVNNCTVANFKAGYIRMLDNIKKTYPNTQIFLCNLTYETWTDGSNPEGYNYPGLRESFNGVIKELSKTYNLPLIDFASVITSSTESMASRKYLGDNIHPSSQGMEVLANKAIVSVKYFYNN